ncbi:Glutamine transport ATP-binding protein GlnQ [compost metagenome]
MITEKYFGWMAFLAIGVVVAFGPAFHASVLATVGIFALLGLSLVLLGLSGQVSLGHAAFMGLAAYTSSIVALRFDLSSWLSMTSGILATMGVAFLLGLATLRLRGHFLALTTLAWGIAIAACFRAAGDLTGGASGLRGVPGLAILGFSLVEPNRMGLLIWACVVLVMLAMVRVQRSRVGRAFSALRNQEGMAEAFGVAIGVVRLQAFVASAGIAGLAGGLYAHYFGFISPSPFELSGSIKALMIAVVGGELHPVGALIGAFTVEGLSWLLQDTLPLMFSSAGSVELIVYGMILIAVMVWFHDGIWSYIQRRLSPPCHRVPASPLSRRPAQVGKETLLDVQNISVHFGGLRALDGVSFEVRSGEIVGLIGPNGAGKSTAFDVISGARRCDDGTVRLFGAHLPAQRLVVRAGLSRSFQHTKLIDELPVLENVMMGGYQRSHTGYWAAVLGANAMEERQLAATALDCLKRVGLDAMASSPAANLSLGQRRLVEVARALAADPHLLLLDEPAAGLRQADRVVLARLLKKLNSEGLTILIVEHDMDLVMSCADRLVVLDRGRKIADGSPAQVRSNAAVIEAYLGGAT